MIKRKYRQKPPGARKRLVRKSKPKRRGIAHKKRKQTKIGLWREWNVPDGAYHRYEGLRGIYWYWLSRDVRQKEWEKYGVCLTCLEPIEDWRDAQCGHVVASAVCGEYLRFHRKNLTIQHAGCNNPYITPQAAYYNSVNYNARHGQGAIESLMKEIKTEAKEPKAEEYRELIRGLDSYQQSLL